MLTAHMVTVIGKPAAPQCCAIATGSQSGTVALPLFAPYACSKFGVEALSDCLRLELASQVRP